MKILKYLFWIWLMIVIVTFLIELFYWIKL